VKRLLLYKPAAQRELGRMGRSDAERIFHALEVFAATGHGDFKALIYRSPESLTKFTARSAHARAESRRLKADG
jgi:tRNA A37 N6-isopentenylltransferase MiaA